MVKPIFDGRALYADGPDENLFHADKVRPVFNEKNSEVVRRPAFGVSMASHAIACFSTHLCKEEGEAMKDFVSAMSSLQKLLSDSDLQEAFQGLSYEKALATKFKHVEAHTAILWKWFKVNKNELYPLLSKIMPLAAAAYSSSFHLLDLLVHLTGLGSYAEQVRPTKEVEDIYEKWKKDPVKYFPQYMFRAFEARRNIEVKKPATDKTFHDDAEDEVPFVFASNAETSGIQKDDSPIRRSAASRKRKKKKRSSSSTSASKESKSSASSGRTVKENKKKEKKKKDKEKKDKKKEIKEKNKDKKSKKQRRKTDESSDSDHDARNEAAQEAKELRETTAFSAWPLEEVKKCQDMAVELQKKLEESKEDQQPVEEIRTVLSLLPIDVLNLRLFPEIPADGDVDQDKANDAVRLAILLASQAESFWSSSSLANEQA